VAHTAECNGCGRSVTITDDDIDLHMAVDATGCGCCTENHHHGQAASACPGKGGNHPGAECPHPDPVACTVLTPEGEECPGGHCGLGIPGCSVCRPLTITLLPGSVIVTPVGGPA
jgi:hypothetical protein